MTAGHVLLTGAAGFLGVETRAALEKSGTRVLSTDAHATGDVAALDVSDRAQVDRLLSTAGPVDTVVHLAAAGFQDQGLVAGANADTARAVRVNVEGFVNVVEAAAERGVRRVVWSSSTTVYGPAAAYAAEPISTEAPLCPTTAYGATKAACEHLGPILAARTGTEVVSLRLPMVYGPHRWYGGSQQALVDLVEGIDTGRRTRVQAWDGDADWIHVRDAADALVALCTAESVRSAYHAVGHRGSFVELAESLLRRSETSGPAPEVEVLASGAPDLPATDDSDLRTDTAFAPRYPDAASAAASLLAPTAQPLGTNRKELGS